MAPRRGADDAQERLPSSPLSAASEAGADATTAPASPDREHDAAEIVEAEAAAPQAVDEQSARCPHAGCRHRLTPYLGTNPHKQGSLHCEDHGRVRLDQDMVAG
jgi:hypothetical protein